MPYFDFFYGKNPKACLILFHFLDGLNPQPYFIMAFSMK